MTQEHFKTSPEDSWTQLMNDVEAAKLSLGVSHALMQDTDSIQEARQRFELIKETQERLPQGTQREMARVALGTNEVPPSPQNVAPYPTKPKPSRINFEPPAEFRNSSAGKDLSPESVREDVRVKNR